MSNLEILLKKLEVVAFRVLNSTGGTATPIPTSNMSEYGRTNEEKLLLKIISALEGVVGGGAGGSFPSAVTVTNEDEAFSHMRAEPVAAGTSVVDVLITILTKYNAATITLNYLSVETEKATADADGATGVYNVAQQFTNVNNYLEVGQGFKVKGFGFTINNHTNTADTGVKFYVDGGLYQENISDQESHVTLTPSSDTEYNSVGVTGETKAYRCSADDIGDDASNPFDPPIIRYSNIKYIKTVDRAAVGTNISDTWSGLGSNAFTDLTMISDTGGNPVRPKGDIIIVGDANTDSTSHYMWIAYPQSWGTINQILQGVEPNTTPVEDGFLYTETHDITNAYGITISYSFYRSNATAPLAVGQTLTITFN